MNEDNLPAEIVSITDIQNLVKRGFNDWKRYGEVNVFRKDDLLLFNYTTKAQYEGRWNFFETVSRGLIIQRKTGEIVARPFDKFWNWLERGRRARGHIVTVTEKLDGSLGILYRHKGEYRFATRGSFEGIQAEWATKYLQTYFDINDLPHELTLLFEIIFPDNRVVLDYGGREDLVLLAARNRHTGDYLAFFPDVYNLAQRYGFSLPQTYQFNDVAEIIARAGAIDATQEGWVVEFSDGSRFKFKGDRYLELSKIISGLTFKNVLLAVSSGTLDQIREIVPDEFLNQVERWAAEIQTTVDTMKQEVGRVFESAPKESRKDYALRIREYHPSLSSYLFALYDGRELEPLIYKLESWKQLREENSSASLDS
jgi:RNA ligase